tara:strand:- start:114502 stop:114831 length:330 start_codon:yes stop_codon:yes gene_type:complete
MDNNLSKPFQALGDATRLAVVERLLKSDASVSELAEPFEMALPAFTKHLGVLERAGLIVSHKTGRVRTCAINPNGISQIEKWFSNRRNLWTARLERLSNQITDETKDDK